ncbi:MAG TPA: hypothetical protein PKD24_16765 [Pyrinomonadaceae bacterium]|nr:hypothetical protein [Pyrinomonadaceae bacterium]HMP67052.1 hypothetical protein [Pyrinomonadaceae bacterium]
MRSRCFILITLAFLLLFPLLSVSAQEMSDDELRSFLDKVDEQAKRYTELFRDLTATETRVDELFDRRERRTIMRTVESDLVVLESRVDGAVQEYLIVRKVDGRPIRNSDRRALSFLSKLSKATSSKSELQQLQSENLRHVIGIRYYGYILSPLIVTSANLAPFLEFTVSGSESADGHDVLIIDYRQVKQTPDIAFEINAPSELKVREAVLSGRMWVSKENHQLFRLEERVMLISERFSEPFCFLFRNVTFRQSRFDINVPAKMIWETYSPILDRKVVRRTDDQLSPGSRVNARSVSAFGEFERFNVEVRSAETENTDKK